MQNACQHLAFAYSKNTHHCVVKGELQPVVLQDRGVEIDCPDGHLPRHSQSPAPVVGYIAGEEAHQIEWGPLLRGAIQADPELRGIGGALTAFVTEDESL